MRTTHKIDFLNRAYEFVSLNGPSGVRKIIDGVRYRKNTGRVDANLPPINQAAQWLRGDKRFNRTMSKHEGSTNRSGPYPITIYSAKEAVE